ncbi:MAG: DNA alkylation repair protein [Candidatus Doudnabacteria bacterium CG10_big_fil_rev_8_21_14_0_10_42_18]|uniref:DNA alkylation repair protein n=1 Tax=Candidatus Doudnabacteria bacterium CG10_big_fil_rev_8_21_14_0_10_42_18 TaxID=1974552 RepID=A0A2H0VB39_9BACT|nr:MAG: DNA alkylation repair protein [Candidatus Doudnabacteria bacterium CG10_big_fil_rev_8_21_14_0_10_42_18]
MSKLSVLKKEIIKQEDPIRAKLSLRYFKTGKGQYGEGDVFLGLNNPTQRKIARQFQDLSLDDAVQLLKSKIHEERQIALFILIGRYQKGTAEEKKKIFNIYLKNTKYINNWDLVDLSAPQIVGDFLLKHPRNMLYKLAKSKKLWEKRIAILATFAFIRQNDYSDTLLLAKILLNDSHGLIHKAVGWMLREVGKRDVRVEEEFLFMNHKTMPRTMLRYAIEKFPRKRRLKYLRAGA